jgi:hypothetical protein
LYAHTRNSPTIQLDWLGLLEKQWDGNLVFTVKGRDEVEYELTLNARIVVKTINENTPNLALRTEVTLTRPDTVREDWNAAISKWWNTGSLHGRDKPTIPHAHDWFYPNLLHAMDNEFAGSALDGMFVTIRSELEGGTALHDDLRTGTWRTAGVEYGHDDPNRPPNQARHPYGANDEKSQRIVSSVISSPRDAPMTVCPGKGKLLVMVHYPQGRFYGASGGVRVSLDWGLKAYNPMQLTLTDLTELVE